MTPRQIDLVRSSYAQATMLANQPAIIFLDHLFAADPALRCEFLDQSRLEGERLMRLLAGTVFLLDRPRELQATFEVLGTRLPDRGIARRREQAFSAALIQTLEACLQSTFTPDVREAWQALCSLAGQYLTRRVPELSLAAA
jgi:hemoglobin-like flavoprotein